MSTELAMARQIAEVLALARIRRSAKRPVERNDVAVKRTEML